MWVIPQFLSEYEWEEESNCCKPDMGSNRSCVLRFTMHTAECMVIQSFISEAYIFLYMQEDLPRLRGTQSSCSNLPSLLICKSGVLLLSVHDWAGEEIQVPQVT